MNQKSQNFSTGIIIVFLLIVGGIFSISYAEKSDAELIQEIWDYCNYDGPSGQFSYGLEFRNETHYLDNNHCKWIKNNEGVHTTPFSHPPPLKQVKSGVAIQDISCNGEKVLIFKQTTLSPACVTQETWEKLMMPDYGWAKMRLGMPAEEITQEKLCQWYPDTPLVQKDCTISYELFYNVEKDNTIFDISYTIRGGIVDGMGSDDDADSLLISIDSIADSGEITISIPKLFFDYYSEDHIFSMFVLENQEEILRTEIIEEKNILLKFNFTQTDPIIEIIYTFIP